MRVTDERLAGLLLSSFTDVADLAEDLRDTRRDLATEHRAHAGTREVLAPWQRCLYPASVSMVCDKPLQREIDRSWRCADRHYNNHDMLVREALGRLVREVWVVWARDQMVPKAHHLLPWEQLAEPDREVDRRIGETLAGIRDWRVGQRMPSEPTPIPAPEPAPAPATDGERGLVDAVVAAAERWRDRGGAFDALEHAVDDLRARRAKAERNGGGNG